MLAIWLAAKRADPTRAAFLLVGTILLFAPNGYSWYCTWKLNTFGSESYSKEELVAEMGAAMLCGVAGIERKTLSNSAAYLQSWINVLKTDSRMVVSAAAQAQKAADYIRGGAL